MSHGNGRLDGRVGIVAEEFKVFVTEGVNVDVHDFRAPTLRRIAALAVARLCKPRRGKGLLVALHRS